MNDENEAPWSGDLNKVPWSDLIDWTDSSKKIVEMAAAKNGVTIDEFLAALLRGHLLEILAGSSSELVPLLLPITRESEAVQEVIDDMFLSRLYNEAPGMTPQEVTQWVADAIQKARKIAGE